MRCAVSKSSFLDGANGKISWLNQSNSNKGILYPPEGSGNSVSVLLTHLHRNKCSFLAVIQDSPTCFSPYFGAHQHELITRILFEGAQSLCPMHWCHYCALLILSLDTKRFLDKMINTYGRWVPCWAHERRPQRTRSLHSFTNDDTLSSSSPPKKRKGSSHSLSPHNDMVSDPADTAGWKLSFLSVTELSWFSGKDIRFEW